MFMTRSPVDELASIRNKIAELRAREAALEVRFLEMNDTGRFSGFNAEVVVERNSHEVFDIMKLPQEMLDDPRYYATRHVTTVRIEEREDPELAFLPSSLDEDTVIESYEP